MVQLVTHFVWKEKWAKVRIYSDNWVRVNDQGSRRKRLADWIQGNLGNALVNGHLRGGTK